MEKAGYPAKILAVTAAFRNIRRHLFIIIGLAILLLIVVCAIIAPFVYELGPLEIAIQNRLQGPSSTNVMGTDEFGRDIFSRTCYGVRVSLEIGIIVTLLTTIFGGLLGLVSGYYRLVDAIVSRIIDGLMAFPEIILAITIAAVWGSGEFNIIIALTFAYFPKMTRVVRASVLSLKPLEYIESGRAIGAGNFQIIFRYILVGCISPIIVQATFCFASAILAEAALSFLGVGIMEPQPSLGGMVSSGRKFMSIAPWIVIFPGGVIMMVVLGLSILGDGLRDLFDPKLKS
ncbi:ABC transporter permease [Candidatus Chlorohelix sp.]|uniref:ABC transporter permease n=1 Tax=Candidatus Chlorohelix sp. TaxID=3139201 RepID=UPI003031E71C